MTFFLASASAGSHDASAMGSERRLHRAPDAMPVNKK